MRDIGMPIGRTHDSGIGLVDQRAEGIRQALQSCTLQGNRLGLLDRNVDWRMINVLARDIDDVLRHQCPQRA